MDPAVAGRGGRVASEAAGTESFRRRLGPRALASADTLMVASANCSENFVGLVLIASF